MPYIELQCPNCTHYTGIICDNSCGTYYCPNCDIDLYENVDGYVIVGHKQNCG